MTAGYVRAKFGYVRTDRATFIERGAPMSGGGTAWLIWYRLDPSEVTTDRFGSWERDNGGVVRSLHELTGEAEWAGPEFYAHRNDAGSLAEAKDTAARVLEDVR